MKIVLIQPPIEDFYQTEVRLQPLGLCLLKAALGQAFPNDKVLVRDYHQGWGRKTIALPSELTYLKPYYAIPDQSPFCSFHHYYHFGADYDLIGDQIAELQPDVVGISSLFSPYYREVLQTAAVIRKRLNTIIVVGGSHASCSYESLLADFNIDFVIRGEGERPLVELIEALRNNSPLERVANLAYRQEGALVLNSMKDNYPLCDLPNGELEDLSPNLYQYKGRPVTFILTSRGCPHQCTFCSVHLTFGRKYRRRTVDDVIGEMEERYNQGYRVFDFEDDNLTFDRKFILELCDRIKIVFNQRSITLLAMNGISYRSLDRQVLEAMYLAGFRRLNLALVSSNQRALQIVNRPHRVDNFVAVVNDAVELQFDVEAHQIIGLPGESLDSIISGLQLLAGLPLLIGVSIFYLTPGTAIADEFPEMTSQDIFKSRSTAMAITSGHCSRNHLYTLFITARILNFIKGFCFSGKTIDIHFLLAEAKNSKGRKKIGGFILERLFNERKMYGWCNNNYCLLSEFDIELFFRIQKGVPKIITQDGSVVSK